MHTSDHLCEATALLFTQYRQGTHWKHIHSTVNDLRQLIYEQIVQSVAAPESFAATHDVISRRISTIRDQAAKSTDDFSVRDAIHYSYREILLPFDLADQIIATHEHDPEYLRVLLDDLPILRPFEYRQTFSAKSTASVTESPTTST